MQSGICLIRIGRYKNEKSVIGVWFIVNALCMY